MGLDMYAYKTKKTAEELKLAKKLAKSKKEPAEKIVFEAIHYWRKHPDLHGMMEKIYREKGGTEEFNCVEVFLDAIDLTNLEKAIINDSLPKTEGFFFGASSSGRKEEDLEFIRKANKALLEGYTIFYTSWW